MNGEVVQDAPASQAAASPQKKSLFNRPKWSKPAQQKEKDEVAFFSRAKELFPLRISEEERKREKRQARAERKRTTESVERKRATESAERKTPDVKRRRISAQEDGPAEDHDDDDEETSWTRDPRKSFASRKSRGSSSSQSKVQTSPTSLSDRYNRDLKKTGESSKQAASHAIITLSDSEGDDLYSASPVKKTMNHAIGPNDCNDDHFSNDTVLVIEDQDDDVVVDDEYSELVEKARQKRAELEKQKALERRQAVTSFAEKNHGTGEVDDVFGEDRTEVDPILEILVTSHLDGAKPLVLKRRLSQRLKEVKAAWTDRQDRGVITEEMKLEIVLTWRGKHLFDVATCAHLGIKVGPDGKLPPEGLDDFGRLHLEAWTNESLAAFNKQQENEQQEPEPEPEVQVEKIKLILKAKDMDPVKMRVSVTYLVRKVEEYFRIKYPEIGDQEVLLYFEGDKLDPATVIKDTELGEDITEADTIEVLIR